MSGPVAELEGILQSMLSLKAPGVTAGKITGITTLCNTNIHSETVLIQRIYTHFKKAPPTHKLGVLYVVDSVTRGWVEQARKAGQSLGPNEHPPDGTFAAGHKRVAELLPSFMSDIISTAPEDQKARISKLIDIWERSGTFPTTMLTSFREKLAAPVKTSTPPGSPPKDFISLNNAGNAAGMAAQAPNTSNILQALAAMAKTNAAMPGQQQQQQQIPPAQPNGGNMANVQNPYAQSMPPTVNAAASMAPFAQAVNAMGAMNGGNPYGAMNNAAGFPQSLVPQQNGQMNLPQANSMPAAGAPSTEQLQQQIQIIQMLQAQGVPQDQWAPVIAALMAAGAGAGAGANAGGAAAPAPAQSNWNSNPYGGQQDASRDRNGYSDSYGMQSPSNRHRRSRSRSPSGYDRRRDPSPRRRRDSPTYGAYGRNDDRSGRGGNPYRQRSPDRSRRSNSPRGGANALPPPGAKSITWDNSMPPDHIRVLSRTLFVGGVTSSDDTLRRIFEAFGIVQTCIVNVDKRHAFVKMLTREHAVTAREGMERYKSQEMQLRTRWGVGFGPRDCSDYSTGISVIPLHRLTDADRKWMLTAEYGGTGGRTLEGGMVIEEPDIEIGAGVSSKAISRRMATDKSGYAGPRSSRDGPGPNDRQQANNNDDRNNERPNNNSNNNNNNGGNPNGGFGTGPGAAPFQFPAGFPQLPPGFTFPMGMTAPGQPPPPGAS